MTLYFKIGAGIAAFALKGDLKAEIVKNMNNGMKNYGAEGFEGVSTTWDLVQKELHCCGVETYGDWKNATTQFADGGVPDSCCKGGQVEGCGKAPVDKEKVFAEGCFSLFTDEFNSNLTIVGGEDYDFKRLSFMNLCFSCCSWRCCWRVDRHWFRLLPWQEGWPWWKLRLKDPFSLFQVHPLLIFLSAKVVSNFLPILSFS
jgi:hypothetical protein